MIKLSAYLILVSFIEAQLVQWTTIYTDKKSIKWMLKWFMIIWTVILALFVISFAGGYGLYALCDLVFE